jgi:hypothetical protein
MNSKIFKTSFYAFLAFMISTFYGCEAIKGIFKAGVWVGVLMVVGGIALVIWLISSIGGKNRQ